MTRRPPPGAVPRQHGIAAIELALIMAFAAFLAPAVVLIGSVFWQYNALQKGVHAAARYLATLPPAEMYPLSRQNTAVTVVQDIVIGAATDGHLSNVPYRNSILVECGSRLCSGTPGLPASVHVAASAVVDVSLLHALAVLDDIGIINITADTALPYGN